MILSPLSILLVDDDDTDIQFMRREFAKNNVANPLYIANNGLDALDMLRGTNGVERISPVPRIIILDLNMPKMGGVEFLEELRADEELRNINVFVLTAFKDDKDRVEALNYSVAGYINKPVTVERFIQAVSKQRCFWQLCYGENKETNEPAKMLVIPNRRFKMS